MSTIAKYTICISAGALLELVSLGLVIGSSFNPGGGSKMEPVFAFIFPYMAMVAPIKELNALAFAGDFGSLLQMPLYGWVLGRAWVRQRFWPEVVILVGSHIIASMYSCIVLQRQFQ